MSGHGAVANCGAPTVWNKARQTKDLAKTPVCCAADTYLSCMPRAARKAVEESGDFSPCK